MSLSTHCIYFIISLFYYYYFYIFDLNLVCFSSLRHSDVVNCSSAHVSETKFSTNSFHFHLRGKVRDPRQPGNPLRFTLFPNKRGFTTNVGFITWCFYTEEQKFDPVKNNSYFCHTAFLYVALNSFIFCRKHVV